MAVGEAESVRIGGAIGVGAGGGLTATVTLFEIEPPAPVQVRVNVSVVGKPGVVCLPDGGIEVPVQAPEALQEVTFVDVQVSVVTWPGLNVVGEAMKVRIGAGRA